jgi:hypothetical protein
VTPNNEPNDIPKLAQDKDEPSLRVPPTDLMATHSSNAAKSFQKLLQFAMSQQGLLVSSEIDVSATQVESAAASSPVLEQTDQTTGSVARNQQRSKGKSKKKKNKRNKGHNAKN